MRINYKRLMSLRALASDPKRLFILLVFLALALFLNSFATNESIEGKVIKVYDGDTITVLDKRGKKHSIRFYGIDAPETNQPFGKESKNHLASLVANKSVKVTVKDKDKYGRIVGIVKLNGKDINKMMVASGYAWAYTYYTDLYLNEHKKAKKQRLGLWRGKNPIEPYKWRKDREKSPSR